jgi:hypothetical protein
MYIRIAEVLQCAPDEVIHKPAHWSGAALTLLDARAIVDERKKSKGKKS